MPQPVAPPTPRKWPHRVIIACATFLWFALGIMALADFGAFVDGPGVGYFGSKPSGAFYLSMGSFASFVVALVLVVKWPFARWIGLAAGCAAFLVFLFGGAPIALMHFAWSRACVHGDDAACRAWIAVLPDRDARRQQYAEPACRDGDQSSCEVWLETGGPRACRAIVSMCVDCERDSEGTYGRCSVSRTDCEHARALCPQ